MPGYTPAPPTLPEPVIADDTAGTSDDATTTDATTTDDTAASSVTEQTTVIPTVESSSSTSDAGFAEVMDDFDSYRNFSDVEEEPTADAKPKRRLFGRRKKSDVPSRASSAKAASAASAAAAVQSASSAPESAAQPEPAADSDSVWAPATAESTTVTNEPVAADTADELLDAEPADSGAIAVGYTAEPGGVAEPAAPDEVETALHEIQDSATATPSSTSSAAAASTAQPVDEPSAPALAYSELAEGESYAAAMPIANAGPATESADTPETETADDAADSASRRRARAALRDDSADDLAPTADALKAKDNKKATKSAKKAARAAAADTAAEHAPTEQSPVKAWALLILEVLAGIAIGIGLFWGFTELWKWNVWFALVLAVLVIFGIVTFAHVVRHARDLFTTLLALGVGLIVTMGPLVLLT